MEQRIKALPGQIYRHFKGKLYQVIGIAEHTETGETLVIYQALYGTFKIYARPREMFVSEVDRSKYSETEYPQRYRFEPMELTDSKGDTAVAGSSSEKAERRKKLQTGQEFLMAFLETDSYREKLDILQAIGNDCTETIVNSMALSLDMGLKGNSVEECKEEIRQSLMLHMKYEGRRK